MLVAFSRACVNKSVGGQNNRVGTEKESNNFVVVIIHLEDTKRGRRKKRNFEYSLLFPVQNKQSINLRKLELRFRLSSVR